MCHYDIMLTHIFLPDFDFNFFTLYHSLVELPKFTLTSDKISCFDFIFLLKSSYCGSIQEKIKNNLYSLFFLVTSYSPLGSPDRPWAKPGEPLLLEDQKLIDVGKKYNKTPAQVCIKWQIQRGLSVLPKSVNASRIKQNSEVGFVWFSSLRQDFDL